MAKIDKIKEFIGFLKVAFGILVAIDVSMIGWLFKNATTASTMQIVLVTIATFVVGASVIVVNRAILKKIDELEDL